MGDDLFDLAGRIVVLTGGLGQLGRAYTAALVQRRARVAVVDIAAPGEDVGADREDVLQLTADVTDRRSLTAALRAIEQRWGTPSGLINNAALDSPPDAPVEETGPFESYPEDSWDRVLEVNLKGPFLCSQVFGSAMAAAGGGSIVNISSVYGVVSPNQTIYRYRQKKEGKPFFKPVAYSASKSGVLNLTRYLATYWASSKVRVNTLTLAGVFNHQDEEFLSGYLPRVPMGRMADEKDYNGAIVFLLSDASAYMTGSNLVIDGGWTAW
jgi:NAD(P)-dependent dehydrogenase (short-subunit alcohol dehydrogenase family)